MAKPSDFFLGVTDLFSVLLPGASFSFILVRFVEKEPTLRRMADRSGLLQWSGTTPKYVAFVVASYLAGHGLDMVGAFVLDRVYDKSYAGPKRARQLAAAGATKTGSDALTPTKSTPAGTGDGLLDRAKAIAASEMPQSDRVFQWCRAWLLLKSPGAFLEVERVQGNSKFFRAMVSAFLGTAIILGGSRSVSGLVCAAACVLLASGSFLRYCDLRWKAVQQTYRLFIAMHTDEAEKVVPTKTCEEADD